MSSDETNAGIHKYCDFTSENSSDLCDNYVHQLYKEKGQIDIYNIYAPLCLEDGSKTTPSSVGSVSLEWSWFFTFGETSRTELVLTCSSSTKIVIYDVGFISMQVFEFDPCSDEYVEAYLNLAEVQAALHVKPTQWTACGYTNIYTRQK